MLSLLVFLFACSSNPPQKIDKSSTSPPDWSTEESIELIEALGFWEEGKTLFQDSFFVEASSNFDSALARLYSAKQSDSLDSSLREEIQVLEDSAVQYLVMAAAGANAQNREVPWNEYWDIGMEDVSPEELKEADSILKGIDPNAYTLPITLPLHPSVQKAIVYLSGSGRKFFGVWLNRLERYKAILEPEIVAAGLPPDIIYLAMVESGFNAKAYSPAAASGVWQFIEGTGRRYNLQHNWWLDERRDVIKATRAATSYLGDLYKEFGDWYLAMAAYNCGENRIRRQLKIDSTISFWEMNLPRETDFYVPKILAAMIIGHQPEKFGFVLNSEPALYWDTVTVVHPLSLETVAGCIEREESLVRELNPDLRRWTTPPGAASHVLKIPQGTRDVFVACYDKMDKSALVRWQQHRVKRRETLAGIAMRYGVSARNIQKANGLRNRRVKVGQMLVIPIAALSEIENVERATEQRVNTPVIEKERPQNYTVRRGDNLYDIARRFRISVRDLQVANDLASGSIKAGQKLSIPEAGFSQNNSNNTAQSVSAESQSVSYKYYRVRRGDILASIAKKVNVSVEQLMQLNELPNTSIKAGQRLRYLNHAMDASVSDDADGQVSVMESSAKVPNVSPNTSALYYRIRRGDTLWDIARRFKTTITQIRSLNPNLPDNVPAGKRIRVR